MSLAFGGERLVFLFCMQRYLFYLWDWPVRHSSVILCLLLACAQWSQGHSLSRHSSSLCCLWLLVPCPAYLATLHQDKLSACAYKYIFTGFHDAANTICYFDAATQWIKVSHNFKFSTPSPPTAKANIPLMPKGELDGSGGDPSDKHPLEMPNMETAPITPPSAPMATTNDALEAPALRCSDRAWTNHNYHWLANPNAQSPGGWRKANTAELNREAVTATIPTCCMGKWTLMMPHQH